MGWFKRDSNEGNTPVNPEMRLGIGGLVSAYLIYLGYGLLKAFAAHDEGIPGWVALLFGCLFIAAGAGYLVWMFRAYMRNRKLAEEAAALEENASEEDTSEAAALEENTSEEDVPEGISEESEAEDQEVPEIAEEITDETEEPGDSGFETE